MAGEIVASNALLFDTAVLLREKLNSGAVALKLFANKFTPVPADKRISFTEPGYPGYAAIALLGKWQPVRKIKEGEYALRTEDVTFTTTGPSNVLVYGWWIAGPKDVYASSLLPFPYLMTSGSLLTIRAEIQVWATTLLKPK